MELKGKVALITGASSGIGEAVAKDLDEAGMKLVLTARSQEKLGKLASNLTNAIAIPGEITDPELPQKLVDTAIEKFGQLDVVFSNAGVMNVGSIEEVDIEQISQMVRVNVESVYRMAYVALRHFKKMGSGYLIHTSSISGQKTVPKIGAYCGTKFAVEAFTDSLRLELAGTDIGVSCIAPGTVDTGLYKNWDSQMKDFVFSGGALQPQDIARCVRFILEQPPYMRIPRLLTVPSAEPV
ncbi:SDR family oxidoreductase [Merismopedia glauca]|uniref:Short-chain dehydrogenase n=1 Tax=Merismopedia glauca CCAP 1448/3 TaxID=1296344 RepID=A0A2T1BXM5_9CYAN|nr:SDR family oxidoreductase [Merismopedia glauca]PSB00742.1 short-chain dehydrogenase [Merismopedia glauca CCAP 1448/3]